MRVLFYMHQTQFFDNHAEISFVIKMDLLTFNFLAKLKNICENVLEHTYQ